MQVLMRGAFIGVLMVMLTACTEEDKGITRPQNGTYLSQCESPDGISSANVEVVFNDDSLAIRDYLYDNPDCSGDGGGDLAQTSSLLHSDVDLGSGVSFVTLVSEEGVTTQRIYFVSDSKVYIPNFPETEPQGDETTEELQSLYSFFIEDPTNEDNYDLVLSRISEE